MTDAERSLSPLSTPAMLTRRRVALTRTGGAVLGFVAGVAGLYAAAITAYFAAWSTFGSDEDAEPGYYVGIAAILLGTLAVEVVVIVATNRLVRRIRSPLPDESCVPCALMPRRAGP